MSELKYYPSRLIRIIQNDQQAINAAYQVADFALGGRNQRDQNRILPFDEIEQFSLKGLGGIRIPKRYGGAFVSNKTLAQVFRILNRADSNVGQILQNQISLLSLIDIIGTESQKQFIFNEVLSGKRLANDGSEWPNQDSTRVDTILSLDNDQYYLDGENFYATGSIFAHWLAIKALHPEGHLVLVLVDRHRDGIDVINNWNGFGQRTIASNTVKLHHVKVDPALFFDLRILTQTPNYHAAYSQVLQAAIDVGIAEAAFSALIAAVKKARPIVDAHVEKASQEPYTLQEVGKLDILLNAAILLLDEAVEYLDKLDQLDQITELQIANASTLVAEAKVYANDAALHIAEKLLELGGSRASLSQFNLDQHWRNARVHTLHDPVRWTLHAIGDYYLNETSPTRHAGLKEITE